jgi:hypothetical protein
MIVVDRQRAVRRYLRSFLVVDGLLVVILTLALASGEYYTNIPKMLIVLKFARVFEIDGLFMRRLSTSPNARAGYVISKQLVTIFVIAHTLGILFYAIDFALTQDAVCLNDNSRTSPPTQSAGSTPRRPTRPSWPSGGGCGTSTRCTGASTRSA